MVMQNIGKSLEKVKCEPNTVAVIKSGIHRGWFGYGKAKQFRKKKK